MTFPRLSERLEAALSLVPDGAVVFDVGSDRGDFLLALEAKGNKAYGCENKMGPYDGLVKNLKANQSKVKAFLQDGISFLPEEVDCLTILGMGGRTICGILERGKKNLANVKDLIVSPQSCVEETIEKVNINIAGEAELKEVGFNSSQAPNVVTYREENGLFQVLEDLLNVKGIGEATFNKVKNKICLS